MFRLENFKKIKNKEPDTMNVESVSYTLKFKSDVWEFDYGGDHYRFNVDHYENDPLIEYIKTLCVLDPEDNEYYVISGYSSSEFIGEGEFGLNILNILLICKGLLKFSELYYCIGDIICNSIMRMFGIKKEEEI